MQKVTEYLLEHGKISEDDIKYKKNFPISMFDFETWVKTYQDDSKIKRVKGTAFPTYLIPVYVDGFEFVKEVMIGQGSCVTIYTKEKWKEVSSRISPNGECEFYQDITTHACPEMKAAAIEHSKGFSNGEVEWLISRSSDSYIMTNSFCDILSNLNFCPFCGLNLHSKQ